MNAESGVRQSIVAVLFGFLALTCPASASSINELVAAAKKEQSLNLHAPSALGPQGAQDLGTVFNKKYGLSVRINYISSSSFTADIAKVISQSALGVAPEWDLMLVNDSQHAELWVRKLHIPFDYKLLGVDPRAIQHDNGSVAIAHGIVLPAYNTKFVAAKDMPRKWEDLLSPKWADGKLGVSSATHYFSRLAVGPWGEKKTTEFVKGLAKQRPFLGRLAELYTRLQLGEILIGAPLSESMINRAKKDGAPIVFADWIEPVPMTASSIGVIKGAASPWLAHLFTVFMTSPEAQAIWEKHYGQSSAFVPGTTNHNFVKGKQALFMAEKDADLVEKLAREYSKILGFTR
jgi:iron(III) transport system substrate-binding protein